MKKLFKKIARKLLANESREDFDFAMEMIDRTPIVQYCVEAIA